MMVAYSRQDHRIRRACQSEPGPAGLDAKFRKGAQIAKLGRFMVFDILLIILTANDSIFIFRLNTAILFISSILHDFLPVRKHRLNSASAICFFLD
jgi:hypothetical protein